LSLLGGSIKDRAALSMILDAEEKGLLTKGGYIVEATAGNTGLGLLFIGLQRGYKCLFTCPPSASQEKKNLLMRYGAEVVDCPSVPSSDPQHFQNVARRLAEELGGFFTNQFYNESNFQAHYQNTGPEIWEQTNGEIDYLVSGAGTGGTIGGCSVYLKEQKNDVQVLYLETPGQAAMFDRDEDHQGFLRLRTRDEMESSGTSIMEGIGSSIIYLPLSKAKIDTSLICPDLAAVAMCHYLMKNEGLYLGGSSGVNVAGAYWLAKMVGPGHTIVTFLCDSGERSASKIYNKDFLEGKSILIPNEISLEFVNQTLENISQR